MTAAYLAAADCRPIFPMTVNRDLGHDDERVGRSYPNHNCSHLGGDSDFSFNAQLYREVKSTHHTVIEVMAPASFKDLDSTDWLKGMGGNVSIGAR